MVIFVSLSGNLLLKGECLFCVLQNCCNRVCSSCEVQEFIVPRNVAVYVPSSLQTPPKNRTSAQGFACFGLAGFSASTHVGHIMNLSQFFSWLRAFSVLFFTVLCPTTLRRDIFLMPYLRVLLKL